MDSSTASGTGTQTSQTFDGQSASPGAAYGPVSLSLDGLDAVVERRLRDEEVDPELARVDSAARAARVSLVHQRDELGEHFTEEQLRIFDTHLTMLEDPVLEADLRGRIINDRLSFESALKDMIGVYERLFDVVQSESLRTKLADMRDIALRLLRCAGSGGGERTPRAEDMQGGILVVRELSLSDLTEALEHGIAGIVAEEGSLGSHGTILTRAAGIPAVIGVGGIHESVSTGDVALVDGDAGRVVLHPTPEAVGAVQERAPEGEFEQLGPALFADGSAVQLEAAAASPSEARQARALGVRAIGVYRTELPVIQRQGAPREDSLAVLYRQVVDTGLEVSFRLPDLHSAVGLEGLYPVSEENPQLGLRGVRVLLAHPEVLQTQLRAILRASQGRPVRIAVPFLNDPSEFRAVRGAVTQAREELRLEGYDVSHPVQLGIVVETPAAALLGRELLGAASFAWIGLDTLAQLLLAADVRCAYRGVRERIEAPHPVVLRAVRKLVQVAHGLDVPVGVYGECLEWRGALELLVGVGLRRFALRPTLLRAAQQRLAATDPALCERVAEQAARAVTVEELRECLPASWRQDEEGGAP